MSQINTSVTNPSSEAKEFGMYLKELRQKKGYNQSELAKLAEVASGYYGHFEQGRHIPSVKIIRQLAQVLEVDLNEMLIRAGYDPKVEGTKERLSIASDHRQDVAEARQEDEKPVEPPTKLIAEVPSSSVNATLRWAYECVKSDPNFNFDQRMGGQDLPPATWLGFIEMYQTLTGRVLLKPEEIEGYRNA